MQMDAILDILSPGGRCEHERKSTVNNEVFASARCV